MSFSTASLPTHSSLFTANCSLFSCLFLFIRPPRFPTWAAASTCWAWPWPLRTTRCASACAGSAWRQASATSTSSTCPPTRRATWPARPWLALLRAGARIAWDHWLRRGNHQGHPPGQRHWLQRRQRRRSAVVGANALLGNRSSLRPSWWTLPWKARS
jgi:hypothetical protein